MRALTGLLRVIEGTNRALGRSVAWLVLLMVFVQFALVVMRYVFGTGSLFMQETVIYAHGILFMLAAAWTLLDDRHVRVDVFYARASKRARAWIDLFGALFFVLPMCWLVWRIGYPYVARSWAVFEGSRETGGIPAIFLLKTVILVFAVTVALQAVAMAVKAALVVAGRPPLSGATAG